MGTPELVTLFTNGGITLSFIGFLIWLIKYFMAELNKVKQEGKEERIKFLEAITNHINSNSEMMAKQTQVLEHLSHRIEIACKVSKVFHNTPQTEGPRND